MLLLTLNYRHFLTALYLVVNKQNNEGDRSHITFFQCLRTDNQKLYFNNKIVHVKKSAISLLDKIR